MATRDKILKLIKHAAAAALSALLLTSGASFAAQQVNLTAGPATASMPDGSAVPMWGYSCGAAVSGSTAYCAPLNPAASGAPATWSPVVITVPTGQDLMINLTNNLPVPPSASAGIPTSLTIVGQLGGGLGNSATTTPSPDHSSAQANVTWPIAGVAITPGTPPAQGPRVQSFSTEVAEGSTTSLTWKSPRPGTYLIESGTHPSIQGPMGLYGILVVTSAPTATIGVESAPGTAYPGVSYDAEVPLLLSEIDPAQNNAVSAAVNTTGFSESATIGTNLNVPLASINLTSGGSGYTTPPSVNIIGGGGSGATAVAMIDTTVGSPTFGQVTGIQLNSGGVAFTSAPSVTFTGGGGGSGATATAVLSPGTNSVVYCSGGAAACYPPAVNYTPLYYLINGVAFNKTNASGSLFPITPVTLAPVSGTGAVLVRFVNAGLRMHVPAIVGSQTGMSAVPGFTLIAEDGNPLPGIARVQNEVFLAAGKTYDVMINGPTASSPAIPVYDRQLSLSGNSTDRDSGMVAYIGISSTATVNGIAITNNTVPVTASLGTATAYPDIYNSVVPGQTLTVSDLAKGVIANDFNIFGVKISTPPSQGSLILNENGTFTYTANASWSTSDSFTYCGNGATSGAACATVTLGASNISDRGITCTNPNFTASTATYLAIKTPGILAGCKDGANLPLTVDTSSVLATGITVVPDANGGFTASSTSGAGTYTFSINVQNSLKTLSQPVTVTLIFPTANGPAVTVLDGADKTTKITDYRWIIEEDRTFFVDPKCTANPLPAGCPTVNSTATNTGTPAVFATNFHTSHMPVVATGCTGPLSCEGGQTQLGAPVVCDQGNGVCRPDTSGNGQTQVDPSQANLDPTKRYYLSVLPGDAANPFNAAYSGSPACASVLKNGAQVSVPNGTCGHGMGGAPLSPAQTTVTVLSQPSPYPSATLTAFVFEDDYPLNGEHDAGGGVDILSPDEPGLGGFELTLLDNAGGTGDSTGSPTYDMFNQPLSNSLAGTIDPTTGMDACPISTQATANAQLSGPVATPAQCKAEPSLKGCQKGIVGMIVTCPKYESDGTTLSPFAGQVVIKNLYPGRYSVVATPGADRIARGEEWLQTNTLDGQKGHDAFMRIGEPAYFQEFGPAGYHVTIGFANPKIINDRKPGMCAGISCTNEVKGHVTTARMSRTPDERLYGSGNHNSYAFTQCYASLGEPDGQDFAFVKCDDQGNFDFTGIPGGNWKLTLFDQWNDQVVDGISTPVGLAGQTNKVLDFGEVAVHQWQANFNTRTFLDLNKDGVSQSNEPGAALVKTNVRYRDGSFSNRNNTDLNGYAAFNEEFPLFNWYVIETDVTRYKNTGTHIVYDAGGPTDGTCTSTTAPCGNSSIGANLANTFEQIPLPTDLRVPGARYCAQADCLPGDSGFDPGTSAAYNGTAGSTGRVDPPWVLTEGWQGFSGQNNFLEFGKAPYASGENGGIRGHVVYASTRPFDDPQFGTQNTWEPLVPGVTINLYKEGTAADGVTPTLILVDTTKTSSFDDWAQGFRSDGIPNMNCPGQSTSDPFWSGMQNQPTYLDWYNNVLHGTATSATALPNKGQFKCYDGMHNWNQLQPAPYDGMYQFPSVVGMDPKTGKPIGGTGSVTGSNCTICVPNPDTTDSYRHGLPMLPAGKYVVEVVVPPGYELVKEEDKNILIGDNFIAPVTQQFAGFGNIFILPDQAQVTTANCTSTNANACTYNANNAQNPTQHLGRDATLTSHEGDTPTVDTFWPCVGETRIVPDYISLFPGSKEVAPFAGATRNLCDRKEVTLEDQTSSQAEFFVFTPTHVASHFTGVITDDFSAEFDPFSPQYGEKFGPAYLPVSIKDWAGNEVSRIYADQWGSYNGLNYSTWEVNPPNPTGYAPTMMITCMNDRGPLATPDPLYQDGYSQFCYELPFMPGQTGYFDTPVVPTSAFSDGYNHADCNYPDATPAIASVYGSDGVAGPWVSGSGKGHTITINALGDVPVESYGYSGPQTTTAPFNQQKVTRHYGFGLTQGTVTIGGITATVNSWSGSQITATVPSNVPYCTIKQQKQYGGSTAQCGELVITNANGKQSIDTVTVTIGGKQPTVLATGSTIQSAIDAAKPGDMIIVPPGIYSEMLLMWKPVRLQGVGAASSIINADTQPAGKLDPWRRQVECLFGVALDGTPLIADNAATTANNGPTHPYDPSGVYKCPAAMNKAVDRLPLEAILGWDTGLNGNLAEQLIEPTLLGAYEGAGITVLAKGVNLHGGPAWSDGAGTPAAFPPSATLLDSGTSKNDSNGCGPDTATSTNPFPSSYWCNPSSIDGLTVENSSQGGGGILVRGWAHNIQIANNRVKNNQGTISGGITIGQGEHPDVALAGTTPTTYPASCETSNTANVSLPFCYDMNVNIHHNAVTQNFSLGDELFSSTPAGAGGVTLCTGSDYYQFNYNWICGNMSTGDGGGVAHLGFTKNGDIEHNQILFNQSTNPTITTNGGGLLVMGAPDVDPPCATADQDCVSPPSTVLPSDGTGPGLVINANLIMGNSADSGSGGGLRLQHINGTEVLNFPNGSVCNSSLTNENCHWNTVSVTNNIISHTVAGWDGAGVSLQDALAVNIVNNTIASNDSTATSGELFGSLFAPLASAPVDSNTPGINCTTAGLEQSCPQVAGLVSITNSAILEANIALLPSTTVFSCPVGHGSSGTGKSQRSDICKTYSIPLLANDVIWQNRSFYIGVGSFGSGTVNQQKVVTLYNSFTTTPAPNQPQATATTGNGGGAIITGGTGACTAASYWDIGVRGDTGPGNHTAGLLTPTYSVLTSLGASTDYAATTLHNTASNPTVLSQYCNGSRVPPELGSMGFQVPPGTNETNALPTPVFSLFPSATVDEGNNWINMRWGPLAENHPVSGATLGNYGPAAGSSAIKLIPSAATTYAEAPNLDFYGNARKTDGYVDAGAVEYQPPALAVASITGGPLAFGNVVDGTTGLAQTLTLHNTGGASLTGIAVVVTAPFSQPATGGTCGATLAAGAACTINIVFTPTTAGSDTGTATITANVAVTGSPVSLNGTGVAAVKSATLTPATWTVSQTRNCPGTGFGVLACAGDPSQAFTLTNTGNVTLTGIAQGVLGGTSANDANYSIVNLLSTCGPAGGGQVAANTTLAPGATCVVRVQFKPLTAQAAGSKPATISVTDAAGTQTSTLTGTAR